jgi:hypothetical protein
MARWMRGVEEQVVLVVDADSFVTGLLKLPSRRRVVQRPVGQRPL